MKYLQSAGSQLVQVQDNPNAQSACGCGSSFAAK
jgi:Fe-S cluster assembly iron-binding protein IscA